MFFKPKPGSILSTVYIGSAGDEAAQKFLDTLKPHLGVWHRDHNIVWRVFEQPSSGELEDSTKMHIQTAHLILLLVSHSFCSSDYIKKELEYIRNISENKKTPVVPWPVEDITATELSTLPAFVVSKLYERPEEKEDSHTSTVVVEFEPEQITPVDPRELFRMKMKQCSDHFRSITTISSGGVDEIVNESREATEAFVSLCESLSSSISTNLTDGSAGSSVPVNPKYIHRITKFWEIGPEDGSFVEIHGTVSRYAPLVIGSPKDKRQAHLNYRMQASTRDVNTLMAFTAGQMVWSVKLAGTKGLKYFGLYQSIVRNSVPLFVTEEYFERNRKDWFEKDADHSTAFEAKVIGKVIALPWYLPLLSQMQYEVETGAAVGSGDWHTQSATEQKMYGIIVDGDGTSITPFEESQTKYLDGDIWVVVEWKGKRSIKTRFCDLSNGEDIKEQLRDLRKEIRNDKVLPGSKIVYGFQQDLGSDDDVTVEMDEMDAFRCVVL